MKNSTNLSKTLLTEQSIINFGKYRGCTVGEVYIKNSDYLLWMRREVQHVEFDDYMKRVLDNTKPPKRVVWTSWDDEDYDDWGRWLDDF